MSAQEQDWQDDQMRDRAEESGEERDPTQQPPTHREGERNVGDEGQEQGTESPRTSDERQGESPADRALRKERESTEQGHETPA